MSRQPGTRFAPSFGICLLVCALCASAQAPKAPSPPGAGSSLTTEKALTLAEQGHCKEALSVLLHAINAPGSTETRKKAGILGLRCALRLDDRDSTVDFVRQLNKQFPQDPEVLFILVHAYSDLSTRTAQDLGRVAPQSVAAHKLNAEALEMQGKWDEAGREYEEIIEKEPEAPGIHYLLGRLLLSRPDANANSAEKAKKEFQKELEIDPKNAGAVYILGELARSAENWDEAIARFSQAAKLDPNFAEAYLGLGFTLVTVKRYEEAIDPLRRAAQLTPGNPAVHYNLATALSRSGHKAEAEKEFAIHRSLTSPPPNEPAAPKPQ
jgi:tetratricopeptide (TPR) repeat protein